MLKLYSETYSPTGNVASEGVLNQLGRPDLDTFALLVRESVQNSWDARLDTPIRYGIAGWELSSKQIDVLRRILSDQPQELPLQTELKSRKAFYALAVYDRGTTGLGGPTRADQVSADGCRNFVDFLRNVGQPSNRQFSGGTYGYGKAAFYLASKVRTILVHTRCAYQDVPQSRFMAAALGQPFEQGGKKYTGRHWWGQYKDKVIEPLFNQEADAAAYGLGLPSLSGSERGTTVVVLQPDFRHYTPEQALRLMAEHLLWFFWPKMLTFDGGRPDILFHLRWNGAEVPLPDPSKFPPLDGFVLAMKRLKNQGPHSRFGSTYSISSQRPKQHLGRLALERFPASKRQVLIEDVDAEDESASKSPIDSLKKKSHHVALMRQPELIVKYLEGPELPDSRIEYGGVFIADAEVDAAFAEAEPPSHDDWISKPLDRPQKTFVNVALREVNAHIRDFVQPPPTQAAGTELTPLGAFANMLGDLLPGQDGTSAVSMPFDRKRTHKPLSKRAAVESVQSGVGPVSEILTESTSDAEGKDDIFIGELPGTSPGDGRSSSEAQPVSSTSSDPDDAVEDHGRPPSSDVVKDSPPLFEVPEQEPEQRDGSRGDQTRKQVSSSEDEDISLLKSYAMVDSSASSEPSDGKSDQPTYVKSPPPKRKERARITEVDDKLIDYQGEPAVRLAFEIDHAPQSIGTAVRASVGVVLDGNNLETDPPINSAKPRVLHWIDPQGKVYEGVRSINVPSSVTGICQIVVSAPDVMVSIELQPQAVWDEGEW